MSAPRSFDVVVIGSGIGGLTAALTAARAGRSVLVLEAGKQLGGYLNPFKRGAYSFDPGLHYIGECGPDGQMTRLVQSLGLESDVTFRELSPDGFDRLIFPGYSVATPKGPDVYRDRLARDFPREVRGLDKFFGVLADFRVAARLLARGPSWRSLPRLLPHVPMLAKYLRAPFKTLLDETVKDPLLQAVLAAQGGDYGLPPSRASALIGLGVLDHYLAGAYFPVGASRGLRDALVNAIKKHGGVLERNATVTKIVVTGGRAAGVRTKQGEEIGARSVVSNADATVTYGQLLGQDAPRSARRKVERTRMSLASICLFIGTDLDVAAAGMTDANIWQYASVDLDAAYAAASAGRMPDKDFFFLSSPSLKDPGSKGKAPEGHHTLELVTLVPFEPFAPWSGMRTQKRGQSYDELKEQLADRYLGCVEQHVPGIRQHLQALEVATPVTNVTYAASPRGAIYGPEASPDQMGPFRFDVKGALPGLYLCGSSTLGAGIVPCALSGHAAGKRAARLA